MLVLSKFQALASNNRLITLINWLNFLYSLLPTRVAYIRLVNKQTTTATTTNTLQSLNERLYETARVSRYQKDKPFWILLKQRWCGGNGISQTICKSFAPHSGHITMPAPRHLVFYRPPNQQHQSSARKSSNKQINDKLTTCTQFLSFKICMAVAMRDKPNSNATSSSIVICPRRWSHGTPTDTSWTRRR